jgi:hypothetical protein
MIWGLMITEGNKQKRQSQMTLPPLFDDQSTPNFLLAYEFFVFIHSILMGKDMISALAPSPKILFSRP